jgi:L-amino acid N-acyltransferase
MLVRIATEADLPGILNIYNEAILNTTAVYDYEPHTLAMRQEWFAGRKKDGYPVFVAVDGSDSGIVGFSSLGAFRNWAAYRYTVEDSVYVRADRHHRGIGKQLLAPTIEAAAAMGMHAIVAGIDATNEVSYRLHRHFGFAEVAHFRQVGYKFDRWLDLKFLELIL